MLSAENFTWSAKHIFFFLFSYFLIKQNLTFCVKWILGRQFVGNVKPFFLEEMFCPLSEKGLL